MADFDGNGNFHEYLLRSSDDPDDLELADLLYPHPGLTAAGREEAERERQAKKRKFREQAEAALREQRERQKIRREERERQAKRRGEEQ